MTVTAARRHFKPQVLPERFVGGRDASKGIDFLLSMETTPSHVLGGILFARVHDADEHQAIDRAENQVLMHAYQT